MIRDFLKFILEGDNREILELKKLKPQILSMVLAFIDFLAQAEISPRHAINQLLISQLRDRRIDLTETAPAILSNIHIGWS